MLIAPIHVVELVNIPPELRLESREYSRSAFSGSPSLRPDSAYSYVGYENQSRKKARSFTVPWMVGIRLPEWVGGTCVFGSDLYVMRYCVHVSLRHALLVMHEKVFPWYTTN